MIKRSRFRRRYGRKRRFRSRSRRFTRRVIRAVRRASERKQLYVNPNETISVQNTGYLYCINQLSQGSGKAQRIGNRIKGRWLKVRLRLNSNNIAESLIRVSILRMRTAGLGLTSTPNSDSTTFWDTDLWHIIADKTFTFAQTNDNTNMNQRFTEWTLRVPFPVVYNDNNSLPVTNGVYIYLWGNDAIIPSPTVVWQAMYSYTDI